MDYLQVKIPSRPFSLPIARAGNIQRLGPKYLCGGALSAMLAWTFDTVGTLKRRVVVGARRAMGRDYLFTTPGNVFGFVGEWAK